MAIPLPQSSRLLSPPVGHGPLSYPKQIASSSSPLPGRAHSTFVSPKSTRSGAFPVLPGQLPAPSSPLSNTHTHTHIHTTNVTNSQHRHTYTFAKLFPVHSLCAYPLLEFELQSKSCWKTRVIPGGPTYRTPPRSSRNNQTHPPTHKVVVTNSPH
jgi:hypothetical protein